MRLDFNVLWVDDQPKVIESQIKAIAKQMADEGFQFKPQLCKSIDAVHKLLADDVFTDEVDLILVDWDLGNDLQGQDAIAAIRETVVYKDVVFYSAQMSAKELRELAFAKSVEGVYCASREELVEEVLGVFISLVKKVLDLDHTRGIVMGATSDIDNMVNGCILAIHERLDEVGQRTMLQEALKRIDEKVKDLTKKAAKLRDAASLTAVLESHLIFTAMDRLRILSHLLEDEMFKEHAAARIAVNTYREKVVPGRNDFGHLVLVPEGKPQAISNLEGKQIGLAEARELRKLILDLRDDFRVLHLALQARIDRKI